MGSIANCI